MNWSSLELKIPPVGVVATTAFVMKLSSRVLPEIPLPRLLEVLIASTLLAVSLLVAALGARAFRRFRTTLNPLRPEEASTLVTVGVFRFSRNPIYLGMLCLLLAWALYLSQPASVLVTPLFVVFMNRFQILPEERTLRETFGEDFELYSQRVGRWI